jgi:hypothetical protein
VRVCPATKVNGERCKGIVGAASDYCPAHVAMREGARWRAPPRLRGGSPRHNLRASRTNCWTLPTAYWPVI